MSNAKAKSKALGGSLSKEETRLRAEQSRRDKERSRQQAAAGGAVVSTKLASAVAANKRGLGLNKVAHDFLLSVIDPSQNCCRLPGTGDEPSVPFAFGPTYDLDFSGAYHPGDDVPDKECVILKRRDSLLCDSIVWQRTVSQSTVYTGIFRSVDIATGAATLGVSQAIQLCYIRPQEFMPLYLQYTSGDDLHGDEQYLAEDDDTHWMLLSKGQSLAWTVASVSAPTATFEIVARDGPDHTVSVSNSNMPVGNYVFVVPYTGFYRLMFGVNTLTTVVTVSSFTVTTPTTRGCWRQLSVQDVSDQFGELDSFRVHGASLLCTQASSVTNMNGRVLQMQVPAGRDVLFAMRKSFTDYAHTNTRMFKPRDLYEGGYSYARIADKVKDLSLRSEWEIDAGGVLASAYWPIVSESPMLVYYLYVPEAAGRVFTIQPGLSISADGDSQWKDLQEADGDDKCIDDVIATCRGIPQHMENETHESFISQVADLASMAAPFMGAYGPGVASAAQIAKMLSSSGAGAPKRRMPRLMNGKA
jgi:hypothetical protein